MLLLQLLCGAVGGSIRCMCCGISLPVCKALLKPVAGAHVSIWCLSSHQQAATPTTWHAAPLPCPLFHSHSASGTCTYALLAALGLLLKSPKVLSREAAREVVEERVAPPAALTVPSGPRRSCASPSREVLVATSGVSAKKVICFSLRPLLAAAAGLAAKQPAM